VPRGPKAEPLAAELARRDVHGSPATLRHCARRVDRRSLSLNFRAIKNDL
jgi:hypothetical protein